MRGHPDPCLCPPLVRGERAELRRAGLPPEPHVAASSASEPDLAQAGICLSLGCPSVCDINRHVTGNTLLPTRISAALVSFGVRPHGTNV